MAMCDSTHLVLGLLFHFLIAQQVGREDRPFRNLRPHAPRHTPLARSGRHPCRHPRAHASRDSEHSARTCSDASSSSEASPASSRSNTLRSSSSSSPVVASSPAASLPHLLTTTLRTSSISVSGWVIPASKSIGAGQGSRRTWFSSPKSPLFSAFFSPVTPARSLAASLALRSRSISLRRIARLMRPTAKNTA
eukprot:3689844-Rhodomonas_salina.7